MSELQFPKDPIVGQEYNYAPYKYRWDGVKWKTIGIGYNPVNDLRDELTPEITNNATGVFEALRSTYANVGLTLVTGSFEDGGVLTKDTDVLLHEVSGKAYAWTGTYTNGIHTVIKDTDPTAVGSGYVSKADVIGSSTGGGEDGIVCEDIASLRLLSGVDIGKTITLVGYYADTPGIGGGTLIATSDTTSADNGGTVFVTAGGVRIKRERKLRLKASDFGARGDWNGTTGTDNKPFIEAMIAASNSSQPWEIDLNNVGVTWISIDQKNNW